MKINEGLLEHDLDYTVMPLISIDEYESKIDDRKAIVAGFYVTENDPAVDLAAFIEKGIVKVLDTDVSPAPTEDGHYLVFVELDRDNDFPAKLLKIIDELKNIVNVNEWQFSPLHSKEDENYKLTLGELQKRVNLDPESVEITDGDEDETHTGENKMENEPEVTEQIGAFLKNALLERYSIENNILVLEQYGYHQSYKIEKFSVDEAKIPVMIGTIGDQKLFESNRLQNMLGQYYSVYSSGTHLIVTDYDNYMLLTPVD